MHKFKQDQEGVVNLPFFYPTQKSRER